MKSSIKYFIKIEGLIITPSENPKILSKLKYALEIILCPKLGLSPGTNSDNNCPVEVATLYNLACKVSWLLCYNGGIISVNFCIGKRSKKKAHRGVNPSFSMYRDFHAYAPTCRTFLAPIQLVA